MTGEKSSGQQPLLRLRDLEVSYQDAVAALRGVSLDVAAGSIVALLGANGAGKTTILRSSMNLLRLHRGSIRRGTVEFAGRRTDGLETADVVRQGLSLVMEGRRIFAELSVEENLRAGAYTRRSKPEVSASLDRVLTLFPKLVNLRGRTAGYLSGGEQQMLAIGRALMQSPKLLLLDEPSLGLAPLIVEQIRDILIDINTQGTSVLLVEQNAMMALSIAHHGYLVENGRVVKSGSGKALLADADIQEFYLGMSHDGRKNYRDVKTYRRKKQWNL